MFYIHHHNYYGYQTLQGGYIQCGASFHKVTRSLGHPVLQDHLIKYIRCISTTTSLMMIKRGKVVSCNKGIPRIKSQNPQTMWSEKFRNVKKDLKPPKGAAW